MVMGSKVMRLVSGRFRETVVFLLVMRVIGSG